MVEENLPEIDESGPEWITIAQPLKSVMLSNSQAV